MRFELSAWMPPSASADASAKPLPPAAFWVGGAATLALAGLSTWSGLEALAARDKYDSQPASYDPAQVERLAAPGTRR